MSSNYSTIQQHEPLRVPSNWTQQERAMVAQLEELFDDIYRRFNRIKLTDLSSGLQSTITETADGVAQAQTEISQQAEEIALKLNKTDAAVGVNNSAVVIDTDGVHITSEGVIDVDGGAVSIRSGSSLAMEAATNEDATINGGMIWHGKNMVVSTDEPQERQNGMVWVQPYEESTSDTFFSGVWSRGALQETRWDKPVNLELTGVAQGEPPESTYVCTYAVKVYMYKAPSVTDPLNVQVWLSSEYGGTDVDCGVVSLTETGWYEKTVTTSVWLGNAEHMYIRIVGDSNTAVLKDKPFSVTASLSTQSTQVSRWIPCNVYYYVQVETGITAPTGLTVNNAISSTASTCVLSWTAATVTGASGGITYLIFKDGTEVVRTQNTAYTFSQTDISEWNNAVLTVKAYNADAGTSTESNSVTFTYEVPQTVTVLVNHSKYANSDNSSLANTGGTKCTVGRSTSDAKVGTAMQFLAPDGGWGSYTKATLYIQRTGGTASSNVEFGKMTVPFSDILYTTQFYYGNYATAITSVDVAAATCWVSIDISNALPSGTDELGVTLMSKNAYCTVDGTNAYIVLEN